MEEKFNFQIIFEKLRADNKEIDSQLREDVHTSQEVTDTIYLLRQYLDTTEESQITDRLI